MEFVLKKYSLLQAAKMDELLQGKISRQRRSELAFFHRGPEGADIWIASKQEGVRIPAIILVVAHGKK